MKKTSKLIILCAMIISCLALVGCGEDKEAIAKEKAKEFIEITGQMNDNSTMIMATISGLCEKWDKYPENGIQCAQNMLKVINTQSIDGMAGWGTSIETLFWKTDYDIENDADKQIVVEQCLTFQELYASISDYDTKAYELLQDIKNYDEKVYDDLKEYYLASSNYGETALAFSTIEISTSSTYSYFERANEDITKVVELRERVELDYK